MKKLPHKKWVVDRSGPEKKSSLIIVYHIGKSNVGGIDVYYWEPGDDDFTFQEGEPEKWIHPNLTFDIIPEDEKIKIIKQVFVTDVFGEK